MLRFGLCQSMRFAKHNVNDHFKKTDENLANRIDEISIQTQALTKGYEPVIKYHRA